MTDDTQHRAGACRCGQVRFALASAPLMTMACHCTGCQRMTSSAFSLSTLYPSQAFQVTSGTPVIGGLHGAARHFFCPHCMSWLFTRPAGMDAFVNVRSTLMDDARTFRPFAETYTDEMLAWAKTGAIHSFRKFPSEEEWEELMEAFHDQQAAR